jgi:hypothetical protein
MAKPTEDEIPPTSADEPKDTPPDPSPQGDPPAVETAKEEGEKVPEWGKTLIDQVGGLTEAITGLVGAPAPEGSPEPDATPQRKPWHKRGIKD